jgi:protein-S-isoprenylcysteine O-methyltransferase Ste14
LTLRRARILTLRLTLGSLVLLALFMGHARPENIWADYAFRWGGYALLMAGLGVRLWAIVHIGERKSKQLVTTGPYSVCRNPLYLGTALIALGAAMCFENLPMCLFVMAVVLPAHYVVVLLEERHLRGLFGREYEEYSRATPRFVPRWPACHTGPEIVLPWRSVRRMTVEAMGVLLLPPGGRMIEILQELKWLPVIWRI